MKRISQKLAELVMGCVLALGLFRHANAQLQFTDVRATSGGAIQLYWASETNGIYRIEYASELSDTTVWQMLYEDYPSLGTSTFWTDAGDQNTVSMVGHPMDGTMRFYRVVQTGNFNPTNAPQVSIVSPTNSSTLTGDITVSLSVTSGSPVNSVRLYVDGMEVGYQIDTATNFIINTCQFGNGTHKLFAVVENDDGYETTGEDSTFAESYGVSPVNSVVFDNFITDYRGKLRFQDPEQSETNRFSAAFAEYADWALTITNQDGVAVRTVTGTGFGMEYVWDGTGDGGTNLPAGGYWAVLSASESSFSMLAQLVQRMPSMVEAAMAQGQTSYFLDPPPMPPVLTNGEWVSWDKVYGQRPLIEVPIRSEYFTLALEIRDEEKKATLSRGEVGVVLNAGGDSGSGGQTTALRSMPSVWFGKIGTLGIAYQGNHPNGTSFGLNTRPSDGLFGRVSLNVTPGSYGNLKAAHRVALGFDRYLGDAGYRLKFYKGNFDLHASDLRKPAKGGSSIFNNVNIGLLVGHGVYGTTGDFTISGSGPLQT